MPVDYKDYYSVLGVSEDADQKAVRSAFRKLARQYHPDVNSGDKTAEEKFKEINEANEVLIDPEKRAQYDQMRTYYKQYGQWPGAGGQASPNSGNYGNMGGQNYQYQTLNEEDLADLFGSNAPFSDFFETFFHSSGSNARANRAGGSPFTRASKSEDAESEIDISLLEAYQGVTRVFTIEEGSGATRRLEVKIPAGVKEGARIRLAGQGAQGSTGRSDLILSIHILPDERFTRDDLTLRTKIEVPMQIAVLGGTVPVEKLDGRTLLVTIPEGTRNGRVIRLRNQGMNDAKKPEQRGDLYVEVRVQMPGKLTPKQRELFEAFAQSLEA